MIRGLLAFFVGLALSGVAAPAAASGLDDVAFLEGHWSGDAFGGTIEEIWLPAHGDVLHGVFRAVAKGKTNFSEYIQINVEGDDVIMRFAHFRPDYTTWEGDGPVMELRLTEAREGFVRFEGIHAQSPSEITYTARGDDGLDVTVTGIDGVLHYSRRD